MEKEQEKSKALNERPREANEKEKFKTKQSIEWVCSRSRQCAVLTSGVGSVPVLTSGVGSVTVLMPVGSETVLTSGVGSVPVLTSGVGIVTVLTSGVGIVTMLTSGVGSVPVLTCLCISLLLFLLHIGVDSRFHRTGCVFFIRTRQRGCLGEAI
jgi:hypothetical protein